MYLLLRICYTLEILYNINSAMMIVKNFYKVTIRQDSRCKTMIFYNDLSTRIK